MTTYNIHRWDAIIPVPDSAPVPAVYLEGDTYLWNCMAKGEQIEVQIYSPGSIYHQQICLATLIPVEFAGGFRPNTQVQTGQIVALLHGSWEGYPLHLGALTLLEKRVTNRERFASPSRPKRVRPDPSLPYASAVLFLLLLASLWFKASVKSTK